MYPIIPSRFHMNITQLPESSPVSSNFRQIERWGNQLPFNGFIISDGNYPTNLPGTIIYDLLTNQLLIGDGTNWNVFGGINALPPAGAIFDYGGTSAPAGYLLCDGASLLRATYPALFTAIGTTFGAADGTHFNVPDMRGRTTVGLDNMGGSDAGRLSVANTLGGAGGTQTHTLTTSEIPAHSHPQAGQELGTVYTAGGSPLMGWNSNSGPIPTNRPTGDTGGDGAHNNMQPYILTNKIIKT